MGRGQLSRLVGRRDTLYALREVLGQDAISLWHKDETLGGAGCVVLPGGFSYGDYLRTGAIARFSPIMKSVARFAAEGGLVIGICNGFQILCEAHLLPGALTRNRSLSFICEWVTLRVENRRTAFTNADARGRRCSIADQARRRIVRRVPRTSLRRWRSAGR